MKRAVKHWNRLYRELAESLALEVFKRHVDVMPRGMVTRWVWQPG